MRAKRGLVSFAPKFHNKGVTSLKVTSTKTKKSGGSAVKIIAIILVLAVIGAAAGWYFVLRSTPEKTMKLMLEASEKKDTAAVKALFCAKDQKLLAAIPGGDKALFPASSSPGAGEKPKYKIGTSTITGDKATIPVTFEMPKASMPAMPDMTMTFALVKEEGAWKVDMQATMAEMFKGLGLGDMMKGMGDAMNEMPRPGRRGPARQLPRRIPEEYKIRKRR